MAVLLAKHPAWGAPGIEPRWTRSDKDGVGTAYSDLSRVWFTVARGIINEVYYPTVDRPQIRDLQYLVTDGRTFLLGERQLRSTHEYLTPETLGFRIVNSDPKGRFRIVKEVIADPDRSCLLLRTILEGDETFVPGLRLFALLAPHLCVGGRGNNGDVAQTNQGTVLVANKDGVWLALQASLPFRRCSCGYVGASDGWHDLAGDFQMDWEFDCAPSGNIALMGEIDLRNQRTGRQFVLALGFAESLHHALVTIAQSLGTPFEQHRDRYIEGWQRVSEPLGHKGRSGGLAEPRRGAAAGHTDSLYRLSHALLLAHEDKIYDGALIASLSIPWGAAATDDNVGGYHLVWTRDMCQSATALLAAGDTGVPLRAAIYLSCAQNADGGFYQNFWVDGEPYWRGVQLDETAFPVLLVWRLHRAHALQDFDPYPMVLKAAGYLIDRGPVTPQERWEENSGFSPSTLAVCIAALICAASFARERGETSTAEYIETYADFLESHVEAWTATTAGSLVPDIRRHYIRIHPSDPGDPCPDENPNNGFLQLRNQPPGTDGRFPAKDIVDAGFLELVRYGVRRPENPLIEESLRVVDAVLKVDTPAGPGWRRYNHDGYGQRRDGAPYQGWGYGHAWPLLTGERGHYELAAGRGADLFIGAMESFARTTRLLPEQVWSLPDLPIRRMYLGRPTGGAMPLCWAHAEYLKLVRSVAEGQPVDFIPEVAARYRKRSAGSPIEVWKFNRQVASVPPGVTLRIQAATGFKLHWTLNEWQKIHDTEAEASGAGHWFVDITVGPSQRAPIRFTFFWTNAARWEKHDFEVTMVQAK